MNGFFITGTDTDIGKTLSTTLLTAYFHRQGKNVIPYKPVQSGAVEYDGKLVAPDVQLYQLVLPSLNEADGCTYLLKKPSSPHLAAREEQVHIQPESILKHYQKLQRLYEVVLVEGAGGLIVPMNDTGYCVIDLIEEMRLPVILIARAGLGTINHTVLSIMALRQRGIPIAGIILNRVQKGDSIIEEDNQKVIEQLTNVPILGVIPYIENIEQTLQDEQYLAHLFATFQLDNLMEGINDESTSAIRK
ncbi:dethiobiotin synthase [Anaerobacillus sp. MEB173]|uniref:dethiobiotin synthase n=1 Tax=Anaerobacillus sp. MEB173 TaxID=3383345 RepID=UPI003F921ECA